VSLIIVVIVVLIFSSTVVKLLIAVVIALLIAYTTEVPNSLAAVVASPSPDFTPSVTPAGTYEPILFDDDYRSVFFKAASTAEALFFICSSV